LEDDIVPTDAVRHSEELEAEHPKQPSRSDYVRDYLFLFSVSGLIVLLDQFSKSTVRARLPLNERWAPFDFMGDYIRIVHWKNTGAAFGIFQNLGLVFTILAIVVSIAIIYYFPRVPREDWTFRLALALQLGGAVGNLLDRIFAGEVTDFISVGSFPVFNIADASIFIGVLLLIYGMWQKDRHLRVEKESGQVQPGE
jgi:signal peptidase II